MKQNLPQSRFQEIWALIFIQHNFGNSSHRITKEKEKESRLKRKK